MGGLALVVTVIFAVIAVASAVVLAVMLVGA